MTICSVCQSENDEFAVTCKKCKGFLQNRIPNLNLFETAWGVIESPRATFRQIALAEHKNFSVLLFGLFGIGLSFTALWHFKLGDRFSTLLDLIIIATVSGPVIGIVVGLFISTVFHFLAKMIGGKGTFRTSVGVMAYSLTPIILSVFLVLPIELLTFGMYMFTSNPHPYVLKPLSYVLLIGFDSLVTGWSCVLASIGAMIVHGMSWVKALFLICLVLGVLSGVLSLTSDTLSRAF